MGSAAPGSSTASPACELWAATPSSSGPRRADAKSGAATPYWTSLRVVKETQLPSGARCYPFGCSCFFWGVGYPSKLNRQQKDAFFFPMATNEGEVWSQLCNMTGQNHVIAHLFEWPWTDIATECETYLGPAGFTAVQVLRSDDGCGCQNRFGIPFWLVGEFTTSFSLF